MRFNDVTAAHAAGGHGLSSANGAWQSLLAATWTALGQKGFQGNVQDVAEALKTALKAGNAKGQDLAPALAKAINDALDQAQKTLTRQGVSASKAAELVNRFRRDLSRAIDQYDPTGAAAASGAAGSSGSTGSTGSSSGSVGSSGSTTTPGTTAATPPVSGTSASSSLSGPVGYLASERETLKITTADGDRVTIRFREQDAVALPAGWPNSTGSSSATSGTSASSSSTSTSGTGSTSNSGGSQAAAISSGRIQISVKGNLSSDELKAIDDLVSQVDSLATQFFSGDVQDAFSAAASLNADPNQIANFSLHMSYVQLRAVGSAISAPGGASSNGASTTDTTGTDNTAGSSTSSITGTGANSVTPASSTDSSSAGTASSTGTTDTSGSSSSTGTADTSGSPSTSGSSPQQTIGGFIQDVLGKLGTVSGGGSFNFSMRWKLSVLASALPAYAPSTQSASAPSTQLASDTLKSLS
ncbi:MAG TPA: hypothetical protein VGM84_22805 [Steroidobacteraceae bacterium]